MKFPLIILMFFLNACINRGTVYKQERKTIDHFFELVDKGDQIKIKSLFDSDLNEIGRDDESLLSDIKKVKYLISKDNNPDYFYIEYTARSSNLVDIELVFHIKDDENYKPKILFHFTKFGKNGRFQDFEVLSKISFENLKKM